MERIVFLYYSHQMMDAYPNSEYPPDCQGFYNMLYFRLLNSRKRSPSISDAMGILKNSCASQLDWAIKIQYH